MQSLNTIAKGASFVVIGMIISKLFGYGYRILIARIGPEEYGMLSLALAVFGIITIIGLLGLNSGVAHFVAYYKSKEDLPKIKGTMIGSLKCSIIVSVFLGILLYILADFIAVEFFNAPVVGIYLKILAFIVPLSSMRDIFLAALRSYSQSTIYDVTIKNIGENLLKFTATFLLLYMAWGVLGAIWAIVLAFVLTWALSLYYWHKKMHLNNVYAIESKVDLLKYSLPLLFSTLIAQAIVWSDVLILGYFRPAYEVGIYNAALPTATLMSIIPGAVVALFIPIMTELSTLKKESEFKQTYRTATKWIFLCNFPLFLFLIMFATPILSFLFGREYAVGASSLIILLVGYLLYQLCNPAIETLSAIKKTNYVFVNTTIAAIIGIIINIMLIPRYGMLGGAIGTTVSLIIYGGLAVLELKFLMKIQPFSIHFLKIILAGIISSGAIFLISGLWLINLFVLGILAVIYILTYFIIILLLGVIDKDDKNIFKGLLCQIKEKVN